MKSDRHLATFKGISCLHIQARVVIHMRNANLMQVYKPVNIKKIHWPTKRKTKIHIIKTLS
jgi:hypothetical protein